MKTLREQYVGTPVKFFQTLLITTEQNMAKFKGLLPQLDSYLYTKYGNLTTMDDSVEYRVYVRAWWYSAVDSLNRAYQIYCPVTAGLDGYDYNPLENYGMHEGTTALHSQGTLHVGGSVDDKPRTSVNYTTTQDSATSGRMEGYTISGQGSSTTPTANATIGSSSDTNYTADATLAGHDGESKTANVVDVVTHDRTGNIGVMSSQDMANQELELRKGHFFNYFCEMFVRDCTSGDWDGGYEP